MPKIRGQNDPMVRSVGGWVPYVEPTVVDDSDDLDKLSRADLDKLAEERGLDPTDFKNKGELLSALR